MVSGSKNKKNKMVLAKDAKQLKVAVVVLVLFFGTMAHSIMKVYNDANPKPVEQAVQAPPATENTPSNESVQTLAQDANNIYNQAVGKKEDQTQIDINVPTGSANEEIEIMSKPKARGKMVTVAVSDSGRSNPFAPIGENVHGSKNTFAFLTPPPETLPTENDAVKLINTTISGILYDPYSPSAIINFDGSDYLVKKGDIINHYRILSIGKTQVVVQLGRNIYKAGVGELLSRADLDGNVANLNKKFGGNNVQINVKRKKYN